MTTNPKGAGRKKAHPLHKFQRLAVYAITHARIKRNAQVAGIPMAEYLEKEIK